MASAYEFRWNAWNVEHATKHGCTIDEIESVASNAGRGFPRKHGGGKWLVQGRGDGGRMVEVVFVKDDPPATTIFVIHAMPLITRRKRGRRRR